jgi:hypothetical protein
MVFFAAAGVISYGLNFADQERRCMLMFSFRD